MNDGTDIRGRTVSNTLGKGIMICLLFLAIALFSISIIAVASEDSSADTTIEFDDPEGRGYRFSVIDASSVKIKTYSGDATKITIPETVQWMGATYNITVIGSSAFANNSTLLSLEGTGKVETIESQAFWNCTALAEVTLSSMVVAINSYAFDQCSSLASVLLNDGLQTIAAKAFNGAGYLRTITIPVSTYSIDKTAFDSCKYLTSIVVDEGNPSYSSYYGTGTECDGILYNYSKNQIIICPEGKSGDVTIISSVNTIGDRAFYGCSKIENIDTSSPNSINVGEYAFCGCRALEVISDTQKISSFGVHSFENCTSLRAFLLSTSVTSIPDCAFKGCTSLGATTEDISFNSPNMTVIGVSAFEGCTSLKTVNTISGLQRVSANAFLGCTSLTSLTLASTLTDLSLGSFSGCTSLETISMPDSVEIKETTFSNCTALTRISFTKGTGTPCTYSETTYTYTPWYKSRNNTITVSFPSSATAIGDYLFCGCTGLTQPLTIPSSLVTIGSYAFYGCTSLSTSLSFPSTLKTLGDYAFYGCTNISGNIQIGRSLENMGEGVFGCCSQITGFTVSQNDKFSTDSMGVLYDASKYKLIQCYGAYTGEFTFPTNLITIGGGAFAGCTGLTGSLSLPDTVRTIGQNAFYGCSNLTGELDLPDSVTRIKDYAFYDCSKLSGVLYLSEYIEELGSYAFYNCCSLEGSVTIPRKISTVQDGLFANCYNLTGVIFNNVTSIGDYAFFGCTGLTGKLTITDIITDVGDYAFYDCSKISELSIPITLEPKANTFTEFTGLTTLTITAGSTGVGVDYTSTTCMYTPWYIASHGSATREIALTIDTHVTRIGSFMFYECGYDGSGIYGVISFHQGLLTIGTNAFNSCNYVEEFRIPASVTDIGDMAFVSCWGLRSIVVAEGNVNYSTVNGILFNSDQTELLICPGGFTGSYTIPDTVNTLNSYVFQGCQYLEEIVIPDSVRNIGDYCFNACTSLSSVSMPIDVELGTNSFKDCKKLATITLTEGISKQFANLKTMDQSYPWYLPDVYPKVIIGDGITHLGDHMFDSSNISGLVIASSVTSLGKYILNQCSHLSNLTYPISMQLPTDTSVLKNMYSGCISLSELTLIAGASTTGVDFTSSNVKYMPWYLSNNQIQLTISNGITTIGAYMFYECEKVSGYSFPDSMERLGDYSFYQTHGSETINIPKDLYHIGTSAMSRCGGITQFTVDPENDSFTAENGVLYNKDQDELIQCPTAYSGSYTIASTTTIIRSYAFYGCTALESVVIPENVTVLQDYAFCQCTSLEEITMPGNLQITSKSIFEECINLHMVTLSDCSSHATASYTYDTCKYTPWYVSSYNGNDVTAVVGEGITRLGDNIFCNCIHLVDVTLPSTLSQVGSSVFSGCTGIKTISIPSSYNASTLFPSSNGVTTVYLTVGKSSTSYNYDETNYYTLPWVRNNSSDITVEVSDGVKSIGDYMFYKATKLKSVTLPEGLEKIGDYSFSQCSGLLSIVLPNSLKSLGEKVFYKCSNISEMEFGEKIDSIPASTFEGCDALMKLTFAGELSDIGNRAFYGCTSLNSFVIPDGISTIGTNVFEGCTALQTLTLPIDLRFGETVFKDCTGVKSVTFTSGDSGSSVNYTADSIVFTPWYLSSRVTGNTISISFETTGDDITYIGEFMFYGCTAIVAISIPDTVERIGSYAFAGTSITTFTMPDSVTTLYDYTFRDCTLMTDVILSKNISSCGNGLFYNCTMISYLEMPISLGYHSYMYDGCNSLTQLVLDAGENKVGANYNDDTYLYTAWHRTQNELTVIVNDGIQHIGSWMFYGCTQIKSIVFYSQVMTFGSSVFGNSVEFYNVNGDRITDYRTNLPGNTFEGPLVGGNVRQLNYKEIISVQSVNIVESSKPLWETKSPSKKYFTLTLEIYPENATDKSVVWTSSDTSVVTIDSNGRGTIVGVGIATITVTTNDKGKTDTCEVVVSHPTTYYEEVHADCGKGTVGHIAYWMCDCCGKKYEDQAATKELTSWEIQPTHDLTEVYSVPSTCTTEGNVHYYHCSKCRNNYENPDGSNLIQDVVIPKVAHTMTLIPGIPAVGQEKGRVSSYHCEECDKYYSDELGTLCYESTDTYNVSITVNDSSLGSVSIEYLSDVLVGSEITVNGNIMMIGNMMIEATPKEDTAGMTYRLLEWVYPSEKIEAYTEIEAVFVGTVRQYTVTFYEDEEKTTILDCYTADYGSPVSKPLFEPKKEASTMYSYTFSNWIDQNGYAYEEGKTLSGDLTYVPRFAESLRYYGISFYSDGKLYSHSEQQYGDVIILPDDPTKEKTELYVYSFDKWKGYTEGMTVKSTTEFTAEFITENRTYTATFMSGTEVFKQITGLAYQASIPDPGTPSMAPTDVYQFEFSGWDNYNPGTIITSDVTYNAVYTLLLYNYVPDSNGLVTVYCTSDPSFSISRDVIIKLKQDVMNNSVNTLKILFENGSITLDSKSILSLTNAKQKVSFDKLDYDKIPAAMKAVVKERDVFSISIGTVHQFDGTLTISIYYTPGSLEQTGNLVIWYVTTSGNYQEISCDYKDGAVSFQTNHLSYYSIILSEPLPEAGIASYIAVICVIVASVVMVATYLVFLRNRHY